MRNLVLTYLILSLLVNSIAYGEDDGFPNDLVDLPVTNSQVESGVKNTVNFNNNVSGDSGYVQRELEHERRIKALALRELDTERSKNKDFLGIPGPIWFIVGGVVGAGAFYLTQRDRLR
jgi:hypothetical protein